MLEERPGIKAVEGRTMRYRTLSRQNDPAWAAVSRILTYSGDELIRDVLLIDPPVQDRVRGAESKQGNPAETSPVTTSVHSDDGASKSTFVAEAVAASEPLIHASRETAEECGKRTWNREGALRALTPGQKSWMAKLEVGDLSGFDTHADTFNDLRGERLDGNPRTTPEYKQGCLDRCGLGEDSCKEGYGLLSPATVEMVRWVAKRGASSMRLPDSARTTARGFKHQLITKGPTGSSAALPVIQGSDGVV